MRIQTHQRGLSTSSWLLVAALVGFFLTLLFKMGPAYLDNMGLSSAMKSMARGNADLHRMDKGKIYGQLSNYFTINNVRSVNAKDMQIVRKRDYTLVNHEYEVRVPIFLNIDVVMSFRNQIDSRNVEACCEYLVEDAKKSD